MQSVCYLIVTLGFGISNTEVICLKALLCTGEHGRISCYQSIIPTCSRASVKSGIPGGGGSMLGASGRGMDICLQNTCGFISHLSSTPAAGIFSRPVLGNCPKYTQFFPQGCQLLCAPFLHCQVLQSIITACMPWQRIYFCTVIFENGSQIQLLVITGRRFSCKAVSSNC